MHIYLKNISVKFHDGELGFLTVTSTKKEQQKDE